MNTCCTLPAPVNLHRPLWQRWMDGLNETLNTLLRGMRSLAPHTEAELSLQDAMALNDHTLRDIGAPEWLREQAALQRDADSIALRAARHDLGGGGVRWYG